MHDCPECGGACHCDEEDHKQQTPDNCVHACDYDLSDLADDEDFDDE